MEGSGPHASHIADYRNPYIMTCWPRYLLWLVIALLGAGSMLSACGQKGPLTLPDREQQSQE